MLTNSDLQQIKNIIDPLSKDIKGVKQDVAVVKQDLAGVKQDLKDVKKRVRKIEQTVDTAIKMLNEDDVKLASRVAKIEDHLDLSSGN